MSENENASNNPETIKSLKAEIELLDYQNALEGGKYYKLQSRYGYLLDEIAVMEALLKEHGIKYDPNSIYEIKKDGKKYLYDEESLYERNLVIRESLRKSDDGLAFILVEYERNNPSDKQKHIITKDEVVSWLHMARASDDVIFKITGEIPPVYTDEDDCRF